MLPVSRPPRTGARILFWLLLSALIGYGLWAWTESLWVAVPGGVAAGYILIVLLIVLGERGRDGCLPKRPPNVP